MIAPTALLPRKRKREAPPQQEYIYFMDNEEGQYLREVYEACRVHQDNMDVREYTVASW